MSLFPNSTETMLVKRMNKILEWANAYDTERIALQAEQRYPGEDDTSCLMRAIVKNVHLQHHISEIKAEVKTALALVRDFENIEVAEHEAQHLREVSRSAKEASGEPYSSGFGRLAS